MVERDLIPPHTRTPRKVLLLISRKELARAVMLREISCQVSSG